MSSVDERRVGAIIGGKWRLEKLLGSGSMAAVYWGTHRNGARAALKILHQTLATDVAVCERFLGEGYLTNTVKHPGIVRVFDDGVTDEGCPYLVMDLLEGQTLEEFRVARGGKLQLNETIAICDKIMDALQAVHAAGIIHRDLKPQNIFITDHGELKLLDFGVAKQDARKSKTKGTMTGLVLGTPSFMSPEQAMAGREPVDAKSDVWSLGAIMFTLLTGETVHVAGNVSARLLAAATMKARSVSQLLPNLPSDVVLVVDTALQFKKDERWQSIDAMRGAMTHIARSLPPIGAGEGTAIDVVIPGLDPLLRQPVAGAPPQQQAAPPPAQATSMLPAEPEELKGARTEPAPPPKHTKPPGPVDLRKSQSEIVVAEDERTVLNNQPVGQDGTLIGMTLDDLLTAERSVTNAAADVGLHKGIPSAPPRPPGGRNSQSSSPELNRPSSAQRPAAQAASPATSGIMAATQASGPPGPRPSTHEQARPQQPGNSNAGPAAAPAGSNGQPHANNAHANNGQGSNVPAMRASLISIYPDAAPGGAQRSKTPPPLPHNQGQQNQGQQNQGQQNQGQQNQGQQQHLHSQQNLQTATMMMTTAEGTGPSVRQSMPALRAQLPNMSPPAQAQPQNTPPARPAWPSMHNELTYPPPLDASGNASESRGPRFVVSLLAAIVAGAIAFGGVVAYRSYTSGQQPKRIDDEQRPQVLPDAQSSARPSPTSAASLQLSPALAAFLDAGARVELPPAQSAQVAAGPGGGVMIVPQPGQPGGGGRVPPVNTARPPPANTGGNPPPANTGGGDGLW